MKQSYCCFFIICFLTFLALQTSLKTSVSTPSVSDSLAGMSPVSKSSTAKFCVSDSLEGMYFLVFVNLVTTVIMLPLLLLLLLLLLRFDNVGPGANCHTIPQKSICLNPG